MSFLLIFSSVQHFVQCLKGHLVPPIVDFPWGVVAGCPEEAEVNLLTSVLQLRSELLRLLDPDEVLHGEATKLLHEDGPFLAIHKLHLWI